MVAFKVFLFVMMKVSMNLSADSSCVMKLGLVGVCKPITVCLYLTEMLNAGDFSDLTPCDLDGTVGVFCCPTSQTNATQLTLSETCQKIMDLKQQLQPNFVDYDAMSSVSTIRELPFMAQIMFIEKGFVGAGALISEKFVLTSARVVFVRRSMPIVRLGRSNLDDGVEDSTGLDVEVKKVIPHELYTPREKYNDVALLLLKTPVKFYSHIWPACLHTAEIILEDQQTLTLAGWKHNGRKTNLLTQNKLVPVSSLGCKKFYDDAKFKVSMPNGMSDDMFCANFTNSSGGADSDGPVFVHINGTFFIYALANDDSFSNSQRLGLFTRISDVALWIESLILH